jgi:hypothetical protein
MKKLHFIALLLAVALAACAPPAPQYGQVVTPTEPPATPLVKPVETITPEATLTPRPDAKELAVRYVEIIRTYRPGVTPNDEAEICSFADEHGCYYTFGYNDAKMQSYAKYPEWTGSDPIIESVELLYNGTMSDGLEYQVWAIKGQHSDYPGTKENGHLFEHYPIFVWKDGQWKYWYRPYEWEAKTLHLCGQLVDSNDKSQEGYQAVWNACLTATPLPPTPWSHPTVTPAP